MARTNRLVVRDGRYNITARIANRAFLLRDPKLRTRIVDWIYGIAGFAGIEVDAWCIMENHIHLCVRVPPVPERYWTARPSKGAGPDALPATGTGPDALPATGTGPDTHDAQPARGTGPNAHGFSMRPRERRAPRWTPDIADCAPAITPAGDTPSEEAVRQSVADGVPLVILPRPETGFTMPDEEMLERLRLLYAHHSHGAETVAKRWEGLKREGRADVVAAEKDAFCRRMYNVSQYMKTLKQRISEVVNRETKHAGTLWESRFYSALVGDTARDALMVASYLAWNPVKPRLIQAPEGWTWSSYAAACDPASRWHGEAKEGYERCFGKAWEDIRKDFEAMFAEKMPANYDETSDPIGYPAKDEHGKVGRRLLTVGQLVKTRVRMFERGGYISQDQAFATRTISNLTRHFPGPSARSITFFRRFAWRQAG